MFSSFSNYFIAVVTVQSRAALSLFAAWVAVFALHIIARHGSARPSVYLELIKSIVGVIALLIFVATEHDLLSSSEAERTVFIYILGASQMQLVIRRLRRLDISQFGMESRLVNSMYGAISVFMVTITVAAMCSYFAQQYSGMIQQYPAEKILQWGINVLLLAPIVMIIASKRAYRGLTPKKEVKKPNSNRIRSILLFLAMLIVCEIHGVLLLSYPPENWKDMFGIIAVGLVIGTVYNQVAVPKLDFLNEPSFEHPVSENTRLIDRNI
jgi:hypothetical protein